MRQSVNGCVDGSMCCVCVRWWDYCQHKVWWSMKWRRCLDGNDLGVVVVVQSDYHHGRFVSTQLEKNSGLNVGYSVEGAVDKMSKRVVCWWWGGCVDELKIDRFSHQWRWEKVVDAWRVLVWMCVSVWVDASVRVECEREKRQLVLDGGRWWVGGDEVLLMPNCSSGVIMISIFDERVAIIERCVIKPYSRSSAHGCCGCWRGVDCFLLCFCCFVVDG